MEDLNERRFVVTVYLPDEEESSYNTYEVLKDAMEAAKTFFEGQGGYASVYDRMRGGHVWRSDGKKAMISREPVHRYLVMICSTAVSISYENFDVVAQALEYAKASIVVGGASSVYDKMIHKEIWNSNEGSEG